MIHATETFFLVAVFSAALSAVSPASGPAAADPIRLHPENPHYFLFRGKPAVLITSGEHYGAVLNLDFDYVKYLDAIQAVGLNLTRTFSGVYREIPGSFKIVANTLAPAPNRYLAPWARSQTPGYSDGGNKFDLSQFDPAYFARLKDFLGQASRRGIVVELVLFCPMYRDELWQANPMQAGNNVNGVGDLKKDEPHTLANGRLLEYQLAAARKIAAEVNEFDNLYFEICNEPYFGGVTVEWQARTAEAVIQAEAGLPRKHLIAQNISNGSKKIDNAVPGVSIFNFHYCSPPKAVEMNWGLLKPIADDETGFKGSADSPYAPDGWDFILAGGAVYSNLDYSFSVGREDGSGTPKAPGGGSPALRRSLAALKAFLESFDFIRMAPDNSIIKGGVPEKATARALVETGRQYAVFVRGGTRADLALDLPAGNYKADWVNIWTGAVEKSEPLVHSGGPRTLASPEYKEGIALRIRAERRQ